MAKSVGVNGTLVGLLVAGGAIFTTWAGGLMVTVDGFLGAVLFLAGAVLFLAGTVLFLAGAVLFFAGAFGVVLFLAGAVAFFPVGFFVAGFVVFVEVVFLGCSGAAGCCQNGPQGLKNGEG